MGLSEEAYREALAIAPKISGSLSIIGSSFIIRDVYNHHWRRKRKYSKGNGDGSGNIKRGGTGDTNNSGNNRNPNANMHRTASQLHLQQPQQQHLPTTSRVILSMSIADLGSSFWAHFMSTWLVPRNDELAAFAAGNQATCTTQSFLYELFVYAGLWSNAFLAIAYWLTICRNKSEAELRQWNYQTLLLGLPWIFGLVNSLPKLILGTASYNGFWWCELVDGSPADNLLDQICLGVTFLLIVFSMVALARYVYVQEKKMDRFQYTTTTTSNNNSNNETQTRHYNREKTIQVTYQGLFYIMAWLVIILPTIPITVRDDLPKGYIIFWSCLFPLQGAANSLIYFRPKYRAVVRREQRNHGGRRSSVLIAATAQVLDVELSMPRPMARVASSVMASFRRASNDDDNGVVEISDVKHADEEQIKKPDAEKAGCCVKDDFHDQVTNI